MRSLNRFKGSRGREYLSGFSDSPESHRISSLARAWQCEVGFQCHIPLAPETQNPASPYGKQGLGILSITPSCFGLTGQKKTKSLLTPTGSFVKDSEG
jgi:hypothetical protein